ncbi:MAG: hypothetical protein A2W29_08145 [Gemmatimonadetes bacterium RBG_16_66_8]|nr:MAG: hypothetical protein A2W29_08145 [Gemmatimonadetes bacterium RBG_16_66_8]
MSRPLIVTLLLLLGCSRDSSPFAGESGDQAPRFEAPVLINPESPVSYPEDLFAQRVEGTTVLRLFVDQRGLVVPESTRLAESSGFAALDSAALNGVGDMRFAPARRDGDAVATVFLQPVQFRHPDRSHGGAP